MECGALDSFLGVRLIYPTHDGPTPQNRRNCPRRRVAGLNKPHAHHCSALDPRPSLADRPASSIHSKALGSNAAGGSAKYVQQSCCAIATRS